MFVATNNISWFRGDFLIKEVDSVFGFNPSYELYMGAYMWRHAYGTGMCMPTIGEIPYLLIWKLLSDLFSPVNAQKIIIYWLFTSSGFSMYYLMSVILDKAEAINKRIAKLSSSLFYMMNPFSLSIIWRHPLFTQYFYASVPLLLGFFIKSLSKRDPKFVLLISLSIVIFSAGFPEIYMSALIALFLFYLSFYIVSEVKSRKELLSIIKFVSFSSTFWFFSSFWKVLPIVYSVFSRYTLWSTLYSATGTFSFVSKYSTMINNLRLEGWATIYLKFFTDPYVSWASTYLSPSFTLLSFTVPILAFSATIFRSKPKPLIFFTIICIIGLFFMKGEAEPLGQVNRWLLDNLPFGFALRTPYDKFGYLTTLGYSVLVGNTLGRIYDMRIGSAAKLRLERKLPKVAAIVLVILLEGVYAYPFWTGDVVYSGGEYLSSARVRVPSYYYEAASWIATNNDDFKIVTLPPSAGGWSAYSWEYGIQPNLDPIDHYFFVGRSIIQSEYAANFYSDRMTRQIYELFIKQGLNSMGSVLGLINIRYLIVHDDWNSRQVYTVPSPEYYHNLLLNQTDIYFDRRIGLLSFYRVEDYLPIVYTTQKAIYLNAEFELYLLYAILKQKGITSKSRIIFFFKGDNPGNRLLGETIPNDTKKLQNVSISDPKSLQQNVQPEIVFERIDPTQYRVQVWKASAPFFLVFQESYEEGWRAIIGGEEEVPDKYHFVGNGFGNVWYIDRIGDYTITIEYIPQRLYLMGSVISFITILVYTCVLAVKRGRYRCQNPPQETTQKISTQAHCGL